MNYFLYFPREYPTIPYAGIISSINIVNFEEIQKIIQNDTITYIPLVINSVNAIVAVDSTTLVSEFILESSSPVLF